MAADPDRLFVVEGGGVVVKGHGTVFNMKAREKQDHVDVSLLSGLVVVENHGVSRSLNPGETAVCKKSVPSIEKKTTMFLSLAFGQKNPCVSRKRRFMN